MPIHLDVVILDATLEIGGTTCSTPAATRSPDPTRDRRAAGHPQRLRGPRPEATIGTLRAAFGPGCSTSTTTPTTTAACTRSRAPREARERGPQWRQGRGRAGRRRQRTRASIRAWARSTWRRSSTSTTPIEAPRAPRRWCSPTGWPARSSCRCSCTASWPGAHSSGAAPPAESRVWPGGSQTGEQVPDFGPQRLHPTAGAVLVGARPPLSRSTSNSRRRPRSRTPGDRRADPRGRRGGAAVAAGDRPVARSSRASRRCR